MAKVRVEWLAMAKTDAPRGYVETALARSYGSQTLDVGAASVRSEAAPAFAGKRGLARVVVLAGAVLVAWGPDPTADAEGVVAYPGREQLVAVEPGQKLAFVETAPYADAAGVAGLVALQVQFAAGQSTSAEVDLGSAKLVGITLPAGWDAADLAISSTLDGVAFNPVYDAYGIEQLIKVGALAAARRIGLDPGPYMHLGRFKLRSVLAGAPVNQAAQRTLTLIVQP